MPEVTLKMAEQKETWGEEKKKSILSKYKLRFGLFWANYGFRIITIKYSGKN